MKKLFLGAMIFALAGPVMAKDVYVRGYVRSDGTYVQPHQQTAPNDTRQDNWSSKPNVNPYTGKQGTVDPWAPKAPAAPSW
jgi:hypothetical protein